MQDILEDAHHGAFKRVKQPTYVNIWGLKREKGIFIYSKRQLHQYLVMPQVG